jgi:NAD(P)-dependent dehydrogenase (short-subunit alcohol dehydrogenase family)
MGNIAKESHIEKNANLQQPPRNLRHGQLTDQVAIVTGAGQGIGQRIALRLGLAGAFVLLADISEQGCRETARELELAGADRCRVVPTDVSQEDQCRQLAAKAQDLGGIHLLVNNAGIAGPTALVEDITLEAWEATMSVNLRGVFLCCKHVVPVMKAQGGGTIVNISSVTAKRPLPQRTPYAASKMALIGFTRTLAAELGPWQIRVNSVCPGAVAGPRQESVLKAASRATGKSVEELAAAKAAASPLNTLVDADDVADMVSFLCSSEAAAVTGQDINVSAGAVMY